MCTEKQTHTYLEAAHVVDLGADGQRGQNMDCRENDPEPQVIFSKHLGVKMEVSSAFRFFPDNLQKLFCLSCMGNPSPYHGSCLA